MFTLPRLCIIATIITFALAQYEHVIKHHVSKMDHLEIHVFAWKRIKSLSRLLSSLENAVKPTDWIVSITFHVDFGYNPKVKNLIESFRWTWGQKIIRYRPHHYGLPHNILHSWQPSSPNQYALFLEDDVELSRYAFLWAKECINQMQSHEGMIGCSLYTPIVDEIGPAPNAWSPPKWSPIKDLGSDKCFHFQLPCSWGAIYSSKYWISFVQYYSLRFWIESAPDAPRSRTVEWFKSWKRHLIELMLEHELYLLYPFSGKNHTSFSTNYFEKGVHSVPINQEPVYYDSLKKFDHRFTVPLIQDQAECNQIVEGCRQLESPKIINLYHKRVFLVNDLKISMRELWEKGNFVELMTHSDSISRV